MKELYEAIENLTKRVTSLEKRLKELEGNKTKNTEPKTRDKTKYLFMGSVYGKNQLVLAVVKQYVLENQPLTLQQLTETFDKSLQGSLGVVKPLLEAMEKSDSKKRFFMNDVITLANNKAVVCTQWGAFNIVKFLKRAAQLGYQITQI